MAYAVPVGAIVTDTPARRIADGSWAPPRLLVTAHHKLLRGFKTRNHQISKKVESFPTACKSAS